MIFLLFQNSQGKENKPLMAAEERDEEIKVPLTPYRRMKSRQICPDDSLQDDIKWSSNEGTNTLKINICSQDDSLVRRRRHKKYLKEFSQNGISNSDNILQEVDENATTDLCLYSPSASWRGFSRTSSIGSWRGSPSQRSQDSGYSDSGESNAGYQNEPEDDSKNPQAKHITRIYCPDSSNVNISGKVDDVDSHIRSFSAAETPLTSHCSNTRVIKTGRRRLSTNTNCQIGVATILPQSSEEKSNTVGSSTPFNLAGPSSSSTIGNKCEGEESSLEHKSLVEIKTSTPLASSAVNLPVCESLLQPVFGDLKSSSFSQAKEHPRARIFYHNAKSNGRTHRRISLSKRSPRRRHNSEKARRERSLCLSEKSSSCNKPNKRWSSFDFSQSYSTVVREMRNTKISPLLYNSSSNRNLKSRYMYNAAKDLRYVFFSILVNA